MTNTTHTTAPRVGAEISGKHTVTFQVTVEYKYEGDDDTNDMDEMVRDLLVDALDQFDGYSTSVSWQSNGEWHLCEVSPCDVSVDIVV